MQRISSSRSAAFALLLASTSVLAACSPSEKVEATLGKDRTSCGEIVDAMKTPTGAGLAPEEKTKALRSCEADYDAALAEHQKNAPAFARRQDCEAQFTSCEPTSATHATGSGNFMPLLAGFMIGNMLSNNSGRHFTPQPAYSPRSGGYVNGSGVSLAKKLGKTQFSTGSDALKSAPVRTTTLQRGGFGQKAMSTFPSSGSSKPYSSGSRSSYRPAGRSFGGRSFSS